MKEGHYKKTIGFFDKIARKKMGHYSEAGSVGWKAQQWVRRTALSRVNKPKTILDAGCGNGDFTEVLSKKFPKSKIIGLDFSNDTIKIARKKKIKNTKFVTGDLRKMGFGKNKFDTTVCINTLHHIHRKDLKNVVKNLSDVTKDEIILEMKNRNSVLGIIGKLQEKMFNPEIKLYSTTIGELKKNFKESGFKLTEVEPIFKMKIISSPLVLKFERI